MSRGYRAWAGCLYFWGSCSRTESCSVCCVCDAVWIVLQKRRFGKAAKKLGLKEIKGGDQSKRLRVTSEIGTYDMYYLTGNCHYYNNFEICFDGDGRRVVLAMTGGDNAEVLPFDGDKLTIESLGVTLEIVPFEQ